MNFDRKKIFDGLRRALASNVGFNDRQVTSIGVIVSEFERRGLTDVRWLAYILATAWHEARLMSVREGDPKGVGISDAKARAIVTAYCKRKSKKNYAAPHPVTGQSYYARGFCGLTHYFNYEKFERTLGLSLTTNPDQALLVPVAASILFEGMTTGVTAKDSFTKYQLHDFFNATKDDPVGARRIINGTDKANLVADHHRAILLVLTAAIIEAPAKPVAPKPEAAAPKKPNVGAAVEVGATVGAGTVVAGGSVVAAGVAAGFPWERVLLYGGVALFLLVIVLIVLKVRSKSP